jgi:hypothetical protein
MRIAGGIEVDVGIGEAFVNLAGDGEEEVGNIYVVHDEIFAGVEVDDVVALLFEVVLKFAQFGGFATADVSGEEVVAAVVAAGDGAKKFVDEASGVCTDATSAGEVDVEAAIACASQNEGFTRVAGFGELNGVEGHGVYGTNFDQIQR